MNFAKIEVSRSLGKVLLQYSQGVTPLTAQTFVSRWNGFHTKMIFR